MRNTTFEKESFTRVKREGLICDIFSANIEEILKMISMEH